MDALIPLVLSTEKERKTLASMFMTEPRYSAEEATTLSDQKQQ